ncbi:lytic transglycosylase catalytic [Gottschalkia purinilytica]|uniref:Lytic transglycosylase catalytic n=1 Tax=Gottschalkia purinilytica TaxID=1503 RepID=A0A0L0WDH6_GOTPU|nr:lytic transglycosylase domain-containing protein [Gottschalkia purinilytica]KNF09475.1 lytic transglycosylase catalytic [Gottschalkia purinilytica]
MKIITVRFKTILVLLLLGILFLGIISNKNKILKIIYPLKYEEYIIKYSKKYDLDPWLVAAMIKVESKFDNEAKSRKDARGLMQIIPKTGQWASEQIELENYSDELLYNPEVNIRIGCWYLNKLRSQFEYNMNLVIASYNAGSGNVSKWLKDNRYSDDGVNLKNIPFKETRLYVEKVLKHYENYKKIYGDNYFDIK